jgi:hypothetical protein
MTALSSSSAESQPPTLTASTSNSLAGYAVSSSTPGVYVSLVKGTFVVPKAMCVSGDTAPDYYLIGTGELTDGVGLKFSCSGSTAHYAGVFDKVATLVVITAHTVSQGDKMVATMAINTITHSVTSTLKDATKGWKVSTTYTSPYQPIFDAFWILFRSSTTAPLINFGTLKTSADSAKLGAHTGSLGSFLLVSGDTVSMYDMTATSSSATLASPSLITQTSSGFTITWKAAGP